MTPAPPGGSYREVSPYRDVANGVGGFGALCASAMTVRERLISPASAGPRGLGDRDIGAMLFTAEMYGLQLDLLAAVLGGTVPRARAAAARWRRLGYADASRLGPGASWVWLTRAGLAACGMRYAPNPPALSRLAHIRAVTTVRLALAGRRGLPAGGGVLARGTPAAGPGGHPGRAAGAPAGRRGALAGRRPGALGRGMLGDRGRADPQDHHPDDRDHARTAVPDRRLRRPRGGRRRAGPGRSAARAGPVRVFGGGAAYRAAGPRGARPAGGPAGGPGSAGERGPRRSAPSQPAPAGRERAC